MKGKWKVTSNPIGDKTFYRAYRIIDTSQVDHSGNREYSGDYTENKEEASAIAERLNEEEINK
jgi:hypothetical protein